jgi:hypothetical protein
MITHPRSKEFYIEIWKRFLPDLLGWSEKQVDEWIIATKKDQALNDPTHMIYHQNPVYWACLAIIQARLKPAPSSIERNRICWELMDLFGKFGLEVLSPDHNWKKYQQGVEKILSRVQVGVG